MAILKDHIEISESIEVANGNLPCSFWQVHFFGRDFEPELTDSRHGFLLRAKPHQDLPFLMEELKAIYSKLAGLTFQAVSRFDEEQEQLQKDMEQPMIVLVANLDPLTENSKRKYNKSDRL